MEEEVVGCEEQGGGGAGWRRRWWVEVEQGVVLHVSAPCLAMLITLCLMCTCVSMQTCRYNIQIYMRKLCFVFVRILCHRSITHTVHPIVHILWVTFMFLRMFLIGEIKIYPLLFLYSLCDANKDKASSLLTGINRHRDQQSQSDDAKLIQIHNLTCTRDDGC